MKSKLILIVFILPWILFLSSTVIADEHKILLWDDLLPKSDLDALNSPPDYLYDIPDGSEADSLLNALEQSTLSIKDDPYQQALISTKVVEKWHGKKVKVPGFIVPMSFNDKQHITLFFLVPYYGACIHVPPPPPNQIIYIDYPEGLHINDLYEPYWASGVLHTSITENDVATSAYRLTLSHVEIYTEE